MSNNYCDMNKEIQNKMDIIMSQVNQINFNTNFLYYVIILYLIFIIFMISDISKKLNHIYYKNQIQ